MSKEIDLSIIFVGFNTAKYVKNCLEQVIGATKNINCEIFFIDNVSPTNDWEIVKKYFPKVNVIRSSTNKGFTGGNNIGMKLAKGRYILLLNLDIEITDGDVFSHMIEWMDKNKNVGISSCAFLNPDKTIQGNGGYFPTLSRVIFWMTFLDDIPFIDKLIKPYHPMHDWSFYRGSSFYKTQHKQDWVTGAFFLIRKDVIDDVGYLDEDYFSYLEETDYCYRAIKAGWEVFYVPRWSIVHYGQVSAGSEFALLSEFKNLKLFYKKHMENWKIPLLIMFLKLGALLRIIVFGILKGQSVAKSYVKAYKSI